MYYNHNLQNLENQQTSNNQIGVSIGLPVYNGENFLTEALNSILAQTFKDFELIISDNASTDKTKEICQEYEAKDARIRYYRHQQNLGASWNYNWVFQLSRGKYFKWAAHDDVCTPEFLEKCVKILEQNPSVVLCHPRVRVIDKQGNLFDDPELYVKLTNANVKLKTDSPKPQERFGDLISFPHSCYQIFGVIRTDILKKTSLIKGYGGADRTLLAKLALWGEFYEVPEYLFFLRRHPEQSINISVRSIHLYSLWHDPSKKGQIMFPRWTLILDNLISIQQAPLSWQEKMSCYFQIRGLLRREWLGMIKDIVIAAIQILESKYSSVNKGMKTSIKTNGRENLIFGKIPKLKQKESK